jgi:hypothetical protein
VNRFIPALLLIPVCSLPVGVAYSADPGTLDLRAPELRSTQVQDLMHAMAPADPDEETSAVAVVAAQSVPEEEPDTHLSVTGIGSLYWAARHPAQALSVLLPMRPRDGSQASEDSRVLCAIFVRPPSGRAACP